MTNFTRNERRRHPRIPIKVPFKYQLNEGKKILKTKDHLLRGTRHGFTLDLGLGGMRVVLDDPLRVGDVVPFEIFLFHKMNRVKVFSRVQWVGPKSLGIRFLLMKPEESFCVEQFLESATRAQTTAATLDQPALR
jgi:Tfp pilus assembly protein PilZ